MKPQKIRDKIKDLPQNEKATFKGIEIARVLKKGKYKRVWKS